MKEENENQREREILELAEASVESARQLFSSQDKAFGHSKVFLN